MSAFEQLVVKLLATKQQVDSSLKRLKWQAAQIEQKYEPRREFDRWKQTVAGKAWKQQQHQKQQGCCAACRCQVPLNGSHIDHIQPISRYPQIALSPSNLRILCPECNIRKGSQIEAANC